jgi:translation initiation factor eIF-2B subunit gamma
MFGIDKKSNSLVYVDEEYGSNEDLDLRMSLLWKYPHVSLMSRFLDSHVYILRRPVLELLGERPNLSSLREDVLPWLVKLSYRKTHRKNWGVCKDTRPLKSILRR